MKKIILIAAVVALISACIKPIIRKEAKIELEVNGELWLRVSSLNKSAPDDKHYIIRIDDDGTINIIFGDGKRGAIPLTGTNNIKVTYPVGKSYSGVRLQ